jgi:hypothetical protein
MRGEYGIQFNPFVTNLETPPRARGRREQAGHPLLDYRNTPACAGKTECGGLCVIFRQKHPRVRGEDLVIHIPEMAE